MTNMMVVKAKMAGAKESAAKWDAQVAAANVLNVVVRNMVQVVAEADECKLLRDKREVVEDSEVVPSSQELADALATLKEDWRGSALANHYNSLATWFSVLAKSRSFAEWTEVRAYIVTVRAYFHNHWSAVTTGGTKLATHFEGLVDSYRREIVLAASKKLPPVALAKAVRKAAIRKYIHATHPSKLIVRHTNSNMYFYLHCVHELKQKSTRGFTLTFKIWANAIRLRAMYPRC